MSAHQFDIDDKKRAIRSELVRLSKELGRTPTGRDYKRMSQSGIGFTQIEYLYGNWTSALEDAGLQPNPLHSPPRTATIPTGELIDEFIRVANTLNVIPSMRQFAATSRYSYKPYVKTFGSWKKAVAFMLDNHRTRITFQVASSEQDTERCSARRRKLPFKCPLLYEPTNEFETIALFVHLAEDLGYQVKSIRSAFPDAILIRDGMELETEFEYLSSNYLQHGHPLESRYICICWRRDVEIQHVETLSLEEYVRGKYWEP